jgi:hypothetical protein
MDEGGGKAFIANLIKLAKKNEFGPCLLKDWVQSFHY